MQNVQSSIILKTFDFLMSSQDVAYVSVAGHLVSRLKTATLPFLGPKRSDFLTDTHAHTQKGVSKITFYLEVVIKFYY